MFFHHGRTKDNSIYNQSQVLEEEIRKVPTTLSDQYDLNNQKMGPRGIARQPGSTGVRDEKLEEA